MTTRSLAALALAAVLGWSVPARSADEPKLPNVKAFDKLVIDTLRTVHNKGADLYNEGKDFTGAYRIYQGALMTVRPLLAHRPDTQKIIDTGLDNAEKEADVSRKAFLLHDTIEGVRKNLKAAISDTKPTQPTKKPEEKAPDEPKKTDPPMKKVEEPAKKADESKPATRPTAPTPKEVKPK